MVQRRLFARDDFHQRRGAVQQSAAQFGKADITPAGNDMVGQRHDGLLVLLMADLWATQNHFERRARRLKQAHQRTGLAHVPDVDAKTDHLGLAGLWHAEQQQQLVGQFDRAAGDGVLAQRGLWPQLAHVGQQIAQAERGVDVLGVERAEHDGRGSNQHVGHGSGQCCQMHLGGCGQLVIKGGQGCFQLGSQPEVGRVIGRQAVAQGQRQGRRRIDGVERDSHGDKLQ